MAPPNRSCSCFEPAGIRRLRRPSPLPQNHQKPVEVLDPIAALVSYPARRIFRIQWLRGISRTLLVGQHNIENGFVCHTFRHLLARATNFLF